MADTIELRPFVPSRDYGASRAFYEALGFTATHADDSVTVLEMEGTAFILQNYYVQALAENFMVQLLVADADAWWATHDVAAVSARFGLKPPIAPTLQHWGLKVGFIFDPSGVLWHVAERPR